MTVLTGSLHQLVISGVKLDQIDAMAVAIVTVKLRRKFIRQTASVNQLAAQRGLASGTTPARVLETVSAIRRDSPIPIVLYIYYNLVHHHGQERFIRDAAAAGVDGLLVLDLPPDEAGDYERQMKEAGLCAIYLVAPTTPEDRIATIVRRGTGSPSSRRIRPIVGMSGTGSPPARFTSVPASPGASAAATS